MTPPTQTPAGRTAEARKALWYEVHAYTTGLNDAIDAFADAVKAEALAPMLTALEETDKYLTGCGDNSCWFRKPKGMATNGGCRCFKFNPSKPPGALMSLAHLLRAAEKARAGK